MPFTTQSTNAFCRALNVSLEGFGFVMSSQQPWRCGLGSNPPGPPPWLTPGK